MDKNKIIEAAAKLVAKGSYDKAIKEYQKVLEADPKDVRVLQKMGELYQKKNDNAQAAQYFIKVAESYSSDGFFLKAVALYKQVLKLNPGLIDVNLKLAELHQQLGLMSESMAYFQIVANHYDKQGDTRSSLDTLKKMVDLDPDNVASRIKLAELYARENMNKEALQEFKRAAEYLKRNNRTDDYLRVAERLSTLDPDNVPLARELAQSYLAKGDQKRALAKLQLCFKVDPRDVETLQMLAQAFQGLGQTAKTVSVYKELAKVYSDKGQSSESDSVWKKIEALDPTDPDLVARKPAPAPAAAPRPAAQPTPPPSAPVSAQPAPQPSPSGANRMPPPASAPAPAAPAPAAAQRAPAPAAGGKDQLGKLLTETDVYVKYGLHDKALEHLRRVFAIDPENLDAHEKAYQIYVSANNHAQAAEQLLNVLRLCTLRQEVERAQPYLATMMQENPHHPEVPAFLSVLQTTEQAPPPAEAVGEDAILVDSNDDEIIVADAPEDALAHLHQNDLALVTAASEPADEVVSDETLGDEPMIVAGHSDEQVVADEPIAMVADSGDEQVVEDDRLGMMDDVEPRTHEEPALVAAAADEDGAIVTTDDDDDDVRTVIATHSAPMREKILGTTQLAFQGVRTPEPAFEDDDAPLTTQPVQELQEEEELEAEAAVTMQVPAVRPDVTVRVPVPQKPAAPAPAAQQAKAPAKPAPTPQPVVEEAVEAPEEELPAQEECDEAGFFLDQGLLDEARDILETLLIAYPNHPRAQELMARLENMEAGGPDTQPPSEPEAVSASASEGGKDAFDLAAELADELSDLGPSEEPAPAPGEDFQYSVEEVFAEFKKGLEKVVKPEDVETHYDLGIAYKEMGLMEDAIGEFSVAREGCAGKKKEVDCITMIGLIQMMLGQHDTAAATFRQGLRTEFAVGETQKALEFELATALEAMGEGGKALFHFQRVAKLDPKYRDVGPIVDRLAASAEPEPDDEDGPPNGANGHGKKPVTGASPAAKPPPPDAAPGKARKVGYV